MTSFERNMTTLKVLQQSFPVRNLNSVKTVLAVAAGKGGVGKSSVAVNLALALKNRGFKVGLLDADIYGPSLEQMLPKGIEPTENPQNPEMLLPGLTLGMPFISVAHFRKGASIVRAPIANQIITQFLDTVEWGELDYLIIDFPPGTGDIQLTLMQKAFISGAIMVTTPQIVATLDVRKAIQLFLKMEIPILGIIENMSYFQDPLSGARFTPFGAGGGKSLAREFTIPLLGEIPIDPAISAAGDRGESLFEKGGGAVFMDISTQILEKIAPLSKEISEVRQKDAHHMEISIEGGWAILSLALIQENCPCARCKIKKKCAVDVALLEFSRVGRYAVRLTFSSGCSQGIYPLSLLQRLARL